jgi:hypothetical protein
MIRSDSGVCLHATQKLKAFFRLTGFMPLIVLPDRFVCLGVNDDRFDGCGTYVQANQKSMHQLLLNELCAKEKLDA